MINIHLGGGINAKKEKENEPRRRRRNGRP